MRLGTLRQGGATVTALIVGDRAIPLHDAAAAAGQRVDEPSDVLALLRRWDDVEEMLRGTAATAKRALAAGELAGEDLSSLGPPIGRPGKIIAVGRNYAEHAAETGSELPSEPMLFVKHTTSVIGPYDDIVRPGFVADLDYEAELAVVIGRGGRDITEADALTHVAGYCCANDVSARTAQMATGQFVRGKSFDTFCPLGPAIVTADEVGDPQSLDIRCRVDGTTMQDSNTARMIFPVRTLVAHCSAATTLEPGDVILTGTPAGVALGRDPSPWLQPGQLCEVEITGLGRLANRIAAG